MRRFAILVVTFFVLALATLWILNAIPQDYQIFFPRVIPLALFGGSFLFTIRLIDRALKGGNSVSLTEDIYNLGPWGKAILLASICTASHVVLALATDHIPASLSGLVNYVYLWTGYGAAATWLLIIVAAVKKYAWPLFNNSANVSLSSPRD